MTARRSRRPDRRGQTTRCLVAAAIALMAGFTMNGVMASNTTPNSQVGDGTGTVNRYTASSIVWTLDTNSPQTVSTVTFTLSAAAAAAKVKLTTPGTWFSCTNTSGNNWSCTLNTSYTNVTSGFDIVAKSA